MNYLDFNTFLYAEDYPIIKCEEADGLNNQIKKLNVQKVVMFVHLYTKLIQEKFKIHLFIIKMYT